MAARLISPVRRLRRAAVAPPPPAYDHLIASDADFATVFALGDAALAGKVIAIAPGNYATKTITLRPATTTRIIAQNPAQKPRIANLVVQGARNIQFENIIAVSASWGAGATACWRWQSLSAGPFLQDITCIGCEVIGNIAGVVGDPAFDHTFARQPYFTNFAMTFDAAGALTALTPITVTDDAGTTYSLNNVAGLVADGAGYAFTFNDISASGGVRWDHAGSVKPTVTFDVVGGQVVNIVIVSGGTGAYESNNTTLAVGLKKDGNSTKVVTWPGRTTLQANMPDGFAIGSGAGLASASGAQVIQGTLKYIGCRADLVSNAFKHPGAVRQINIGNTVDRVYQDCYAFGQGVGAEYILHRNNHSAGVFSADGHPDDPHSDQTLQNYPSGGAQEPVGRELLVFCEGNTTLNTVPWANSQGIHLKIAPTNARIGGYFANNIIMTRYQVNALQIDRPGNALVWRNTIIHAKPTDTDVNRLNLDMGAPVGSVIVGRNVVERIATPATSDPITGGAPTGVANTQSYPNLVTGLKAASVAGGYAGLFSAFAPPTTRADMIAAVALAPAFGDANFGARGGGYDFGATTDALGPVGDMPVAVDFPALVAQPVNTDVWSAWVPVLGPNGPVNWESTAPVQIANDAAGTGASVAATAGTFVLDNVARKYIRAQIRTAASGSQSAATTVTLNGAAYHARAFTATQTAFAGVDNTNTAYSRIDSPASTISNINRFIIAMRTKTDTLTAGTSPIFVGGKVAANFQMYQNVPAGGPATGTLRAQAIAAATHLARFNVPGGLDTNWHTDIISTDWTKNGAADGFGAVAKWVRDFVALQIDTSNSNIATNGTLTTDSATLFGSSAPRGIGIFREADGGGAMLDGRMEWLWVKFWTNADPAESFIDVTSPDVMAAFSADRFAANGSVAGILPQPDYFFALNPAAANGAGVANGGTRGGVMVKQTGNYA